jgi:two-component system, NtrC family, sensor kinase
MRLWLRLTLAMAVLAVVPVVLVGLSAMEIATRRAEQSSEERLRREAGLQAELLSHWLHDQAPLVLAFPQLYPNRLRDLSPEAQARFPHMAYRLIPSAVTVVLVDGEGVSVAEAAYATTASGGRIPSSAGRVRQLIERLPLTAAIERPDEVHVGVAWLPDGPGSRPSIPFAVLAAGGPDPLEQRVLGVEVALDAQLVEAHTDHDLVALIDADGTPLVVAGQALLDPERLRPLLGTGHESDFKLDTGPGEVRGSIKPVAHSPNWSVVVAEPAGVVLAPSAEIRDRMLPQILVAIAVAAVLALVVASSLSRPVEQLRDAALQVAEGKLGVHVGVHRSDEIGELARTFDHMSDRLATQQARIEAFARELQERVDERTRELREAQEELLRSGQLAAVAELGAGLAHELNNPLAAVLGVAQLLRRRYPEDSLLGDLEAQAERCREVVTTMLRVQEMEVDPTDAPVVQLCDVLQQVSGLVGGSFRQRGVTLASIAPSPTVRARIDPVHGSRILAQILNAMRAGLEPGATVTMSARIADPPMVRVDLVPDRAVAAQPDRRDDWLASGHGLWVARQLLARLGGRLDRGDRGGWAVVLPGV